MRPCRRWAGPPSWVLARCSFLPRTSSIRADQSGPSPSNNSPNHASKMWIPYWGSMASRFFAAGKLVHLPLSDRDRPLFAVLIAACRPGGLPSLAMQN